MAAQGHRLKRGRPGSRGSGSARRAQRGPARLELRGAGRGAGRRLPHPAGALPRGAAPPPPESGRRSEGRAARGSAAARSAPAPVPDGFRALPGARWVFAATASGEPTPPGARTPQRPGPRPVGARFATGLGLGRRAGQRFRSPGAVSETGLGPGETRAVSRPRGAVPECTQVRKTRAGAPLGGKNQKSEGPCAPRSAGPSTPPRAALPLGDRPRQA